MGVEYDSMTPYDGVDVAVGPELSMPPV